MQSMIRRSSAVACALLGLTLGWTTAACRETPPVPVAERLDPPANTLVSSNAPPAPPAPSMSSAPLAPPTASAPEPTSSAGAPPVLGNDLVKRAEKCLEDPLCSLEDAARLLFQADSAGASEMDCFRLYYGIAVPVDLPRARACFERSVGREKGCGDQSPGLHRIYLASMLVDGQGGLRETERGKQILGDCYPDMSVSIVREEAAKRAVSDPPAPPLDFCKDIGGTTLSMQGCGMVDSNKAAFEAQKTMKILAPQLDVEGRALARKAAAAWTTFAEKDADDTSDIYRGGSMRSLIYLTGRTKRERERAEALRSLFEYSPGQDDPAIADKELDRVYRAALSSRADDEARKLLAAAQAAWRVYRTAEVAFHRRALGKQHGESAVARDIAARLARRRIAMITEPREP